MSITLELTPEQAAALLRFCEKVSYDAAAAVLYPHVRGATRAEQTSTILEAFGLVERALADKGARSWPWIETGSARGDSP